MKSILALFAILALCAVASATNPRNFPRNSRDFCQQNRGFNSRDFGHHQQSRDFGDFDQPRTIITETETRRGLFGRTRSQSTTRIVR
jgi:hypothetical protein